MQNSSDKRRNEFWKYRHNPINKREKAGAAALAAAAAAVAPPAANEFEVEREVFHSNYLPDKTDFENEAEFIRLSLAKAQQFNL